MFSVVTDKGLSSEAGSVGVELIIPYICFFAEVTFDHASLWRILCVWSHPFRIVTTKNKSVCGLVFWTSPLVRVFRGLYCLKWNKMGRNCPYV